ncbi:PDT-domain-containing protein [Auriculariales sp. MPI-PUGE-AT-0066]|nr:PDT-domain-containing protein [Auriculariales sp. MPI-PUGE-AT-0066]
MASHPTVAFLGPLGTFSHQACMQMFGSDTQLLPQPTITAAYEALSDFVPDTLLPSENSTHGYVVDTYDILRLPEVGSRVRIRGDTVLQIEHCLVAPVGLAFDDIRVVLSHEQALGQCSNFLRSSLPHTTQLKCASTAEAARLVLQDLPGAGRAAICSRIVVSLYPGLQILRQSIQDQGDNFTRFLHLSTADSKLTGSNASENRAILRIELPSTTADVFSVLCALQLPVIKLDRRPSLASEPFHDSYLVEVTTTGDTDFEAATKRVAQAGGRAALLGQW